jgi:hypothetical protein
VAKRPHSYFWARAENARKSPAHQRLSEAAEDGLELAQTLARDAEYRADAALGSGPVPPPLTLAQLAKQVHCSVTTVRRKIEQARRELWGPIGDRAIYYRLKRHDQRARRDRRPCQTPGCSRRLPREATRRRKYCDGSCRVRAHRAPTR